MSIVVMRWAWMVAVVIGCGPAVAVDGESSTGGVDETSTSATISTSVEPTTSVPTTGPSTTSTVTTVGDDSSDDESSTTLGFIMNPDGGVCFTHCGYCDLWAQDCPEEEKCMPWANDGSDQWNAVRCSRLDPEPAQPGEPCMVEGSAVTGLDDCAISSMCWDVDPDTNAGTCVPFCGGSEANPECADGTSCWIANEGQLILCLPTCDPLAPACGDGLSCVADEEEFFCLPSERVVQLYDDPCEVQLGCGDGLICAGPGSTPQCDATCCTALCDLASPMCPDADAGQTCVPYYEPGRAPEGFEDLGVCLVDLE